jgi:hypothetical protein
VAWHFFCNNVGNSSGKDLGNMFVVMICGNDFDTDFGDDCGDDFGDDCW